jgi:hypothetical protein
MNINGNGFKLMTWGDVSCLLPAFLADCDKMIELSGCGLTPVRGLGRLISGRSCNSAVCRDAEILGILSGKYDWVLFASTGGRKMTKLGMIIEIMTMVWKTLVAFDKNEDTLKLFLG